MGEGAAYGARHPGVWGKISQQLRYRAAGGLLCLIEAGPLARGQISLANHGMGSDEGGQLSRQAAELVAQTSPLT
jgi:hypothetical protein